MNATSVAGLGSENRLRARRGTWRGPARARGRAGAGFRPPGGATHCVTPLELGAGSGAG